MDEYLKLMGYECEDRITGYKGIATSISFDLYGTIEMTLTPKTQEEKEARWGQWFHASRIKKISENPVMDVHDFNFTVGTEAAMLMR